MDTKTYSISDISASILSGGDAAKYDCLDSPTEEYNVPVFANAVANKGLYGYTNKSVVDKEAVTIAARGAGVGFIAYRKANFVPIVRLITIIPNEAYALAKFLYYYLSTQNIIGGGAAIPQLTVPMVKKIKVQLPPVYYQRRIASILSVYDNLIENNNKRIRLLEQMAENLYKEWFVRFRFPGHEKAKFENGLPKGWVVKRMSDFCDVTDGTHDTPKPVDDGVPLITGKCISNGFIDYNEAYSISLEDHEKIKKRSGLSTGDILFSNIGTVGNCCIVDYDREFSVKNVIIFKPNDIIKTAYLYYWMMSDSMQNVFSTQTNGASQQFVGLTFMRRYKILVPEQRILFAFGEKINPLVEQKKKLHRINQNLSRQRDLLLPRLMSGKLEVKV